MNKKFLLILLFFSCNNSLINAQQEIKNNQFEVFLEDSGDILMVSLPAIAGLTTLLKEDWKGTKQFALSFATNLALTYSLKKIVNKQRPNNINEFDAFPSGHTSFAFSGASFIQRRYGWQYGKYAFLLATIVGISRVEGENKRHDYWDVLSGTIIGIGSTYIFTKPYQNNPIKISFNSNGEIHLLSLRYTF
ncbi:phosphatase PAP2 family protein [Flavobacteriaceae bacterium S0862]|nr:phosphatase PAP2 family protein [Flavobacteriaceae bacterium S0862]